MLAKVAVTGHFTRPRRSARAAVLKTRPEHMLPETEAIDRGSVATVRLNTLAAGRVGFAGKGTSGSEGRVLTSHFA